MKTMNIRPSLRLYFIFATILLVSVISIALSYQSIENLSRGINIGSAQTMERFALVDGVEDGTAVDVFGFTVASQWQDLPEDIRQAFNDEPITRFYKLEKKIFRNSFLQRPEEVYLLLLVKNSLDQPRYVAGNQIFPKNFVRERTHIPPVLMVFLLGVLAPLIFLAGLLFIIRSIAMPIESLKNWAKSLDEKILRQSVPDFQYKELNTLANIVSTSLNATHEALEREQRFLSHASHELRTPISVVRANTDLLKKLVGKDGTEEKQTEILARIDRAGKTMTSLTQTLLWLSRDEDNFSPSEPLQLDQVVRELVSDLKYLIVNKPIELVLECEPHQLLVPSVPCQIVLTNLIRNAFQHTMAGKITIKQTGGFFSISNCYESLNGSSSGNDNLGFGLGLRLCRELIQRYGWQYESQLNDDVFLAAVLFRTLRSHSV